MRVVLAFLEFLEGKHGIHANPFNYTLLLNNPPALGVAALCELIPGQALRRHRAGGLGPVPASPRLTRLAEPGCSAPGAPVLPGANRIPSSSRSRVSNCCK